MMLARFPHDPMSYRIHPDDEKHVGSMVAIWSRGFTGLSSKPVLMDLSKAYVIEIHEREQRNEAA